MNKEQQTRDRIGLRIYQLRMMKEWSQEVLARRSAAIIDALIKGIKEL